MEGFLITILMFSVPVLAAIIDKRLKAARKAKPQVYAEPVIFEDEEEEEEPQRAITRTAAEDPWKTEEQPAPEAAPVQMPVQAMPAVQPAAVPHPEHVDKPTRKRITKTHTEHYPTVEEIRRDKRKLILYKEIMTPKFDSE